MSRGGIRELDEDQKRIDFSATDRKFPKRRQVPKPNFKGDPFDRD